MARAELSWLLTQPGLLAVGVSPRGVSVRIALATSQLRAVGAIRPVMNTANGPGRFRDVSGSMRQNRAGDHAAAATSRGARSAGQGQPTPGPRNAQDPASGQGT